MYRVLATVLTLCISTSGFADAVETQDEDRPVVAGILGAVVGFGSGHFYAHERFTSQTAVYGLVDIAGLWTTIGLIQSRPDPYWHTAYGFWVAGVVGWTTLYGIVRYMEGASASREAERRIGLTSEQLRIVSQERFPGTAAFLGATLGFGSGHLYANGRWTPNSTLFAVLDGVAVIIAAAGVMTIPSDKLNRLGPPPIAYPFLPLIVFRAWQAVDAGKSTTSYNATLSPEAIIAAPPSAGVPMGFTVLSLRF